MLDNIRIGTRGSELALWQTNHVKALLEPHFPGITIDVQKIKTTGDKILDAPLAKIGDKGLFTKELEIALLENRVDIAVHSFKDVPTLFPMVLLLLLYWREKMCTMFSSPTQKKSHQTFVEPSSKRYHCNRKSAPKKPAAQHTPRYTNC